MKLYDQLLDREVPAIPNWEEYWMLILDLGQKDVELLWALVLEHCQRKNVEPKSIMASNKKGPPSLSIQKMSNELKHIVLAYLNQV